MGDTKRFTHFTGVTGTNFGTHTVTAAEATANTLTIDTTFEDSSFILVQVRDSAGDDKTAEARITVDTDTGEITVADNGAFTLATNDVISYILA